MHGARKELSDGRPMTNSGLVMMNLRVKKRMLMPVSNLKCEDAMSDCASGLHSRHKSLKPWLNESNCSVTGKF